MMKINLNYLLGTLGLLLLVLLVSCKNDVKTFSVKGKLTNLKGDCFYAVLEKEKSLKKDTILVNEKGEFSFTGQVDTMTVMSLYFNKNTKYAYVLVDKNSKIEMKGDVHYPDLIKVKGGDINNDLTAFKVKNSVLLKEQVDLTQKTLDEDISESERSKSFADLTNVNFELSNIAAEYVKSNPNKIASVVLINTFFKRESTIPRLDECLDLLIDEARYFPLTAKLKGYSTNIKRSAVGATAPSFSLKKLKGGEVKIYDYRGKYVLLSFVSTTCVMCDQERKPAVDIYNKLKKDKRSIDFLTIVIDSEVKEIEKSVTDSVKWTILTDEGGWSAKTLDQYNVHELPFNLLISPVGTILERNVPIFSVPELLDFHEKKN